MIGHCRFAVAIGRHSSHKRARFNTVVFFEEIVVVVVAAKGTNLWFVHHEVNSPVSPLFSQLHPRCRLQPSTCCCILHSVAVITLLLIGPYRRIGFAVLYDWLFCSIGMWDRRRTRHCATTVGLGWCGIFVDCGEWPRASNSTKRMDEMYAGVDVDIVVMLLSVWRSLLGLVKAGSVERSWDCLSSSSRCCCCCCCCWSCHRFFRFLLVSADEIWQLALLMSFSMWHESVDEE